MGMGTINHPNHRNLTSHLIVHLEIVILIKMKRKIWYEWCPGCAFKGVSISTRKLWLIGVQHLVVWRNDVVKKPYCTREWISEDLLFDRCKIA